MQYTLRGEGKLPRIPGTQPTAETRGWAPIDGRVNSLASVLTSTITSTRFV